MSREVIAAALPADFVRMMRNWVRAKAGGDYAMTSAYDGMQDSSGYAISRIPILRGEADEVDQALAKLPARECAAVMLFWQYEGNSLRWLGERLKVDHKTAKVRVECGHQLLRDELSRARAHVHRMRDEVAAAVEAGGSRRATGSIMVVHSLDHIPIDRPIIPQ